MDLPLVAVTRRRRRLRVRGREADSRGYPTMLNRVRHRPNLG